MTPNDSPSPTIIVATLAAAATTGALIAIGHRLGGATLPFAVIGGALLHRTASGVAFGLVLTGFIAHVVAVFAWSAIAVWLVRVRRWRLWLAAISVALAAHLFAWIDAWWTGRGLASVLPLGDRLLLAVVFAGALILGMRFAPSLSQTA